MSMLIAFIVGSAVIIKVSEIKLNNTYPNKRSLQESRYSTVKGWTKVIRNGVEEVSSYNYLFIYYLIEFYSLCIIICKGCGSDIRFV